MDSDVVSVCHDCGRCKPSGSAAFGGLTRSLSRGHGDEQSLHGTSLPPPSRCSLRSSHSLGSLGRSSAGAAPELNLVKSWQFQTLGSAAAAKDADPPMVPTMRMLTTNFVTPKYANFTRRGMWAMEQHPRGHATSMHLAKVRQTAAVRGAEGVPRGPAGPLKTFLPRGPNL
eukprot:TRINITY_DN31562_c0_g1_i1.p2 TRINITY_DN31562_c0_g1~~TRINITY_DN31562_c0_g1_i1.p2  ORF type:complete len:192 (+),score=11.25 TRINITY_DN31562_c0_g1_i1:65-577(+)